MHLEENIEHLEETGNKCLQNEMKDYHLAWKDDGVRSFILIYEDTNQFVKCLREKILSTAVGVAKEAELIVTEEHRIAGFMRFDRCFSRFLIRFIQRSLKQDF